MVVRCLNASVSLFPPTQADIEGSQYRLVAIRHSRGSRWCWKASSLDLFNKILQPGHAAQYLAILLAPATFSASRKLRGCRVLTCGADFGTMRTWVNAVAFNLTTATEVAAWACLFWDGCRTATVGRRRSGIELWCGRSNGRNVSRPRACPSFIHFHDEAEEYSEEATTCW